MFEAIWRKAASPPLKSAPSLGDAETWTPSSTWFLDPTRVRPPVKRLRINSSDFAQRIRMSSTQTALCGINPASMQCSLKDKLSR